MRRFIRASFQNEPYHYSDTSCAGHREAPGNRSAVARRPAARSLWPTVTLSRSKQSRETLSMCAREEFVSKVGLLLLELEGDMAVWV